MTQQAQQQNDQYQEGQQMDGAAMLADLLNRTEYKQTTSFTPFQGTDDNQVKLSPGMVLRFFAKPTRDGHYCSYEQAVRFIMLCQARRLDPREGDAFLVGYDTKNGPEFNLITAHQAFLKRAEASPYFDGMESGVTVKHNATEEVRDVEGDYVPEECTLIGGWARVHRKDRKIATYRRLDLNSFAKGFGVWTTNKSGMICKCAEADALRSTFPNSLAGMYMQGELAPSDAAPVEDARTAPQPNQAYKVAAKEKAKNAPAGSESVKAPGGSTFPAQPAPTLQGATNPVGSEAKSGGEPTRPVVPTNPAAAQTGGAPAPAPTTAAAAPAPTGTAAAGGRPKVKKSMALTCHVCHHEVTTAMANCPACSAENRHHVAVQGGAAAPPGTDAAPLPPRTHEPSQGVIDAEAAPADEWSFYRNASAEEASDKWNSLPDYAAVWAQMPSDVRKIVQSKLATWEKTLKSAATK